MAAYSGVMLLGVQALCHIVPCGLEVFVLDIQDEISMMLHGTFLLLSSPNVSARRAAVACLQ